MIHPALTLRARFSTRLGRTRRCANSWGLGPEHSLSTGATGTETSRLWGSTAPQVRSRKQATSHSRAAQSLAYAPVTPRAPARAPLTVSAPRNTSPHKVLKKPSNTCSKHNHPPDVLEDKPVPGKAHQLPSTAAVTPAGT